jgi:hypothetical protein
VGVSEAASQWMRVRSGTSAVTRREMQVETEKARSAMESAVWGDGGESCVAVLLYNLALSPFSARPLGRREAWSRQARPTAPVAALAPVRASIFTKKVDDATPRPRNMRQPH